MKRGGGARDDETGGGVDKCKRKGSACMFGKGEGGSRTSEMYENDKDDDQSMQDKN